MPKKRKDHDEHERPLAIAADEPEAATPAPHTFNLTLAQSALLETLDFIPDHELAHMRKVSVDVATVFTPQVLAAIAANPLLGGPARVKAITALLDLQAKLVGVVAVLNPLARLASQNLTSVNAQLAKNVSEPLKVAEALASTQPNLLADLGAMTEWNHLHHASGHPATSAAKEPTDPPTKK